MQTLLGSAVRGLQRELTGQTVFLTTPDGDELPALWIPRPGPLAVVVVHGVGGNHKAREGVSLGRRWLWRGLGQVLLLSLRGAFRAPLRPKLYHGGCSEDLDSVYTWLRVQVPASQIVVVGYSLGANITVKWLAETRQDLAALAGAVVVSNPWNLQKCCSHLERSWVGRWYRRAMLHTLRQRGLAAAARFPDSLSAQDIRSSRTFQDYDSRVTAPIHGFSSAEDYYQRCSSWQFLEGVRNRLVCLDALDDPFVPSGSIPTRGPDCVRFERTGHGGHLGFLGSGGRLWMEDFIVECAAGWY
ncbi:alpha/beta hydrolase [bacterium]|nr:alpha/beta hydrolase [bacterium]